MKKACIFDLDGTLMNTIYTIEDYANRALTENGLAPFTAEDYKYFVGNGAKVLVERMLTAQNAMTEENFAKVYGRYNELYDGAPNAGSAPYDGIPELLKELKARGIKTAVLSNKPDFATGEVIKTFFGEGLFDTAHGAREGVPLKPAPDGVYEILDELSLQKEDCLYIGDTGTDMKTGAGAGLYAVGVLWGFRKRDELEENGACVIIEHPLQILDLL